MNYELDSILYEKYAGKEHLTEDDFELFRKNHYLQELTCTKNELFEFCADDFSYIYTSDELRHVSPYGALFYFYDGKFRTGVIIPIDSSVEPYQVRSGKGDKVYYTSNIKVLQYDKHKELKNKIKTILCMLSPIILLAVISVFWNTPKVVHLCTIITVLIISIFCWTVGLGDYKIIKKENLSKKISKYQQFAKNEESLKAYCHKKKMANTNAKKQNDINRKKQNVTICLPDTPTKPKK